MEEITEEGLPPFWPRIDQPWMADAACREHPEVNFFPERGQPSDPAKQVCQGCLVSEECLAYANTMPITLPGIWGGLSNRERRLRRYGPKAGATAA